MENELPNNTHNKKNTNSLIKEYSPYLLQHAHNPVNWYAWNEEALNKAKTENKLILISIGYSACHWCHVMEHESFEDEAVAEIMNKYFVCIKVDREERPDIDQIYMNAVQLISGQGGWPLNCFALPDQRPVYGGTYFPKQQWINILHTLANIYKDEPDKVLEYAAQLTEGIRKSDLITSSYSSLEVKGLNTVFDNKILIETIANWMGRLDNEEGGPRKAPKFPLPNNYQFLLRYAHVYKNADLLAHIDLTLKKMALGGIYDQIGGGFARYSTDILWKVPHFEKMLYDNAQLVSLYSEAYQLTKNELYKEVVYETLDFIKREMTSKQGAFYSALDADSEGEEGKYYVWQEQELKEILKEEYQLFADYYNINEDGYWEHDNYILLRKNTDEDFAKQHNISLGVLKQKVKNFKNILLSVREKRIKPGLDNKIITSWNALMLKAFTDAYTVFGEQDFLTVARSNANYLLKIFKREDGGLFHSTSEKTSPKINGYLEDYAFTIEAFIALYETTYDEQWLSNASDLIKYTIEHFYDTGSGMFYFTSNLDQALIARKMELSDNVIPASNSSMAKSLFLLGRLLGNKEYEEMSAKMLHTIKNEIPHYGSGYSNWGMLLLYFVDPFYEIAFVGNSVDEKHREMSQYYLPNKIFVGSKNKSDLPLLKNRFVKGETKIYVCVNNVCKMPVNTVKEAMQLIETESK